MIDDQSKVTETGPTRDGDIIAGLAKGLAVIAAFDETRPKLAIATSPGWSICSGRRRGAA